MGASAETSSRLREAVASFADRDHFRAAVAALLAAGFAPEDLSVLAAHDSLDAAGAIVGYPAERHPWLPAGLVDEVKWIAPLTVAGIILLSAGPVAASIAALVGAGLGGAALKEILDRYTAVGHSTDFATALAAGAVLLWVFCTDTERERTALRLLEASGGSNAHLHERTVEPRP